MTTEKNILSLFDGMSCGQIALNQIGVEYDRFFASEIDKYAIEITQKNFPKTIQIGSVTELDLSTLPEIFLLMGGSPCQDLSSRGTKKGLDGEKSRLFWNYVNVLETIGPKYFLFENVGSMGKKNKTIISEALGVEPVAINSKIFIPQNRNRLYWTNIPILELPEQTSVIAQDLLVKRVDDKYYYSEYNKERSFCVNSYNSKPQSDLEIARPVKTMAYTGRAAVDNCYHTEYKPEGKTNLRRFSPMDYERFQGVADDYTAGVSNTQRYKMVGNGWTVNVIAHILKGTK